MPQSPSLLLDRPNRKDERTDVLSDILRSMGLSSVLFGRVELGAPWLLRLPERPLFSFYVVARGGAWLTLEGEREPLTLTAGDVALLPGRRAHQLRDPSGRRVAAQHTAFHDCTTAAAPRVTRLGGDGPKTELVGGAFRFAEPAPHPLLASLPPQLHLRADDPAASPWLAATVHLLVAESGSPGPGSALLLERLMEVLLVQALRRHAVTIGGCSKGGLRALVDPPIAAALERIHGVPSAAWTVESLATAVGLSRSGFAARFSAQVGEPPLTYLARWRMTKAAEQLRDGRDSIAAVAARFGYESEAAFHRAFKRWEGLAPGAYRRARRR
jgi:AraC-like DNA-binding protein